MADDYHRVYARIDGEEKPIMVSTTDLKSGLQSMWLSDMDQGWKLLEGRMPDLMTKAMEAYDARKEAEEKKILEKHGVTKTANMRQQVTEMASGKHGISNAILGIGLILVGIGLIGHLPVIKSLLPF